MNNNVCAVNITIKAQDIEKYTIEEIINTRYLDFENFECSIISTIYRYNYNISNEIVTDTNNNMIRKYIYTNDDVEFHLNIIIEGNHATYNYVNKLYSDIPINIRIANNIFTDYYNALDYIEQTINKVHTELINA